MTEASNIALRTETGGVIVPVKVVPGSSRDKIAGVLGDCLKITTAAAPEKGKANAAVIKTLAKALGVSARDVKLISGPTNPRKEFLVVGAIIEDVRKALAGLAG
ncbi:MAG: DUF167 domain-containing protein [Planctomycetota bacterium]|jgi:uncharacterized protein (TIGR00251 family)